MANSILLSIATMALSCRFEGEYDISSYEILSADFGQGAADNNADMHRVLNDADGGVHAVKEILFLK